MIYTFKLDNGKLKKKEETFYIFCYIFLYIVCVLFCVWIYILRYMDESLNTFIPNENESETFFCVWFVCLVSSCFILLCYELTVINYDEQLLSGKKNMQVAATWLAHTKIRCDKVSIYTNFFLRIIQIIWCYTHFSHIFFL